MAKEDIIVLKEGEAGFPARLAELPQPVHRLYCRGDISLLTLPAMAVVGSRKCSEYGRRTAREIGVHAVRGGTVAGEHTVAFFGDSEEVRLTHRADSRRIFAAGALRAAKALAAREPGFYTFEEILFTQEEH